MKTKTTLAALLLCTAFALPTQAWAYEYVPKSPEVKALEALAFESRESTRLIVAAIEENAPDMLLLSGSMVFASLVIAFAVLAPRLFKNRL